MPSFEDRFYLQNPTPLQRLRRDLNLLIDSGRFLFLWATAGSRLRRILLRAQSEQTPVNLEDVFGSGER